MHSAHLEIPELIIPMCLCIYVPMCLTIFSNSSSKRYSEAPVYSRDYSRLQ